MNGLVNINNPMAADPAFQQPLDSFTAYELRVATELESIPEHAPVTSP
jgi:hypothetical protein